MSIFETWARQQKAEKLYIALARAGATLEQLRVMGAEQWDLAARAAGCRYPSAATRELVVKLAEQRCAAAIKRHRDLAKEVADGLAEIEAAAAGETYRPTAEEEDAALDENDDMMAGYWRCQGGAR